MNSDGYFVTKCCKHDHWARKAGDLENVFCWKCHKVTTLKFISKWEEEFEVEYKKLLLNSGKIKNLISMLAPYLGLPYPKIKLKIKARKGKITIEAIK